MRMKVRAFLSSCALPAEAEIRGVVGSGPDVVDEHFTANMIDGSYVPQVNVQANIDEIVLHSESTATFVDEMRAFCQRRALPVPRISGLSAQPDQVNSTAPSNALALRTPVPRPGQATHPAQ
jgi:hypothetical protein